MCESDIRVRGGVGRLRAFGVPAALVASVCCLTRADGTRGARSDHPAGRAGAARVENSRWPARLPADGAWVRYHWVHKGPERFSAKITIRFVGTAVHDGQTCRWVEVVNKRRTGPALVTKMLIPQRALLERPDAITAADVIRTWERRSDGTVVKLSDPSDYSFLFVWAPGASKTLRATGKLKDIDYRRGRLKLASGWEDTWRSIGEPSGIAVETDVAVWYHPDVPCGFAEAHNTVSYSILGIQGQFSNDYTVEDAGYGATTGLPEYE